MKASIAKTVLIMSAGLLAACGMESSTSPESTGTTAKPAPTGMDGATCATLPTDAEFGSWRHTNDLYGCLRGLAYEDWSKAGFEAAHIVSWGITGPHLDELIGTLTSYDSSDAVGAAMEELGLLGGEGEAEALEYYGEDWKPLTGSDWLLKAGNQYSFDAETGTYPNNHDALLYELTALFGDAFAGAEFSETAPHWESNEPYQLHASLGDQEWRREAENYGDWYDVSAVLDLVNEMAAAAGSPDRIMPLQSYDQFVTVIVGPGDSLVAAATAGLVNFADASASMERGKAFEEEVLRRLRIDAE